MKKVISGEDMCTWPNLKESLMDQNSAEALRRYIAYPKLVKALKRYYGKGFLDCEKILRELGELE
jgi:hypothetical protein